MAELTEEGKGKLVSALQDIGAKGVDSSKDLDSWMMDYLKSQGKLPPPAVLPSAPRMSVFSGDPHEFVSFDVWKFEVDSLLAEGMYPDDIICHAARKSLRGEACKISMRLGSAVTIQELLRKLDSVYGTVDQKECLLAEFYSACQADGESVASWACRLEDLLDKAKGTGEVNHSVAQEMLRTKFWTGLRQPLKDVSRHKYDSVKSFDKLMVEMRRIESEYGSLSFKDDKRNKAPMKMITSERGEGNKDDSLAAMISKLSSQMESLQKEVTQLKSSGMSKPIQQPSAQMNQHSSSKCWACGEVGHLKRNCVKRKHLNQRRPTAGGWL